MCALSCGSLFFNSRIAFLFHGVIVDNKLLVTLLMKGVTSQGLFVMGTKEGPTDQDNALGIEKCLNSTQ